jgi:hypothetical protein
LRRRQVLHVRLAAAAPEAARLAVMDALRPHLGEEAEVVDTRG